MPSLILSSRYTADSQMLRQAAQQLGWETLRLDAPQIPDWFEPPDSQVALFYTAPHAFEIAAQLTRVLLGCTPDWTVGLPREYLRRELQQMTMAEALLLRGESFVKHAVSKAFPAAIYNAMALAEAAANVPPTALVHVGEPVNWLVEYRCFVRDREIAAISPYKRHGRTIESHDDLLDAPPTEIAAAREFAHMVLHAPGVDSPPAFVLDVGIIDNRGWAVIECNECWASGIYACDPRRLLDVLARACIRTDSMTDRDRRWDFRKHYFAATSAAC